MTRYMQWARRCATVAVAIVPLVAHGDPVAHEGAQAARDLQAAEATAVAPRGEAPTVVNRPQGPDAALHPAQPLDPVGELRVHARFGHALADGCDYNAAVDGRVRQLVMETNRRDGVPRYRPQLTVTSSVRCPDGHTERMVRRVRGPSFTRVRLEEALETAAKLDARGAEGLCHYAPDVTFYPDGRVRGERMNRTCTVARGGGPRR